MEIYVNDVAHTLESETNIAQLLATLKNRPSAGIAIAVNGCVVSSKMWSEHKLNDGDKVTVIRAFYGG